MENTEKWKLALVLFCVFATLCSVACKDQKREQTEYVSAIKQFIRDENAASASWGANPPDLSKATSEAERLTIIAEDIRKHAEDVAEPLKVLQRLKPPDGFESLHKSHVDFFSGQVSKLEMWSVAIKSGNRKNMIEQGSLYEEYVIDGYRKLISEWKALGLDVAPLEEEYNRMKAASSKK